MGARRSPGVSAECGGPEFVQRELGRGVTTTLRAVFDVAPRTEQTGALGIQHHHEGLRVHVELETEVRPPGRRRIPSIKVQSLQDAAKAHPGGIEEPCAVARLEDERHVGRLFHTSILPQRSDKSTSGRLRLGDGMRLPSSGTFSSYLQRVFPWSEDPQPSHRTGIVLPPNQTFPAGRQSDEGPIELTSRVGRIDDHVEVAALGGLPWCKEPS
jgi:hypothetical protein